MLVLPAALGSLVAHGFLKTIREVYDIPTEQLGAGRLGGRCWGRGVRRGSLTWRLRAEQLRPERRGESGYAGVSVGAVETPDVGRLEVGCCSSLLAAASCRPVITA